MLVVRTIRATLSKATASLTAIDPAPKSHLLRRRAERLLAGFAGAVIYEPASDVSAFGVHVSEILGLCAKEQMIRPNAGRIVTRVKDELVSRNRPVVKFPRNAMCQEGFPVRPDHTVSIETLSGTNPRPARRALLQLGKEPGAQIAHVPILPVMKSGDLLDWAKVLA